ncbi:MAG: transcription elongation factor GreA [Frankiales bacterium]|nr:transcription elongation factor GreA [Frankiales bacterium]
MSVTRATRARLEHELEQLLGEVRPHLLSQTVSQEGTGDAADEAGRVDAFMELERLNGRVAHLHRLLEDSGQPSEDVPAGTAAAGRIVELRFAGETTTESFLLGTIEERDAGIEVVTADSPLGRALLGQTAGTTVTFVPRQGRPPLSVELVAVSTAEVAA